MTAHLALLTARPQVRDLQKEVMQLTAEREALTRERDDARQGAARTQEVLHEAGVAAATAASNHAAQEVGVKCIWHRCLHGDLQGPTCPPNRCPSCPPCLPFIPFPSLSFPAVPSLSLDFPLLPIIECIKWISASMGPARHLLLGRSCF